MSAKMDETDPAVDIICDGCGQPRRFNAAKNKWMPLKQCSRCLLSWYHDADCQKMHYKVHKAMCHRVQTLTKTKHAATDATVDSGNVNAMFTIRKRSDGELGVFASRDIPPNNAMTCRPFAPPVLLKTHRMTHCALCFQKVTFAKGAVLLCENPRYPVLLCSDECRMQCETWLPQETKILDDMLSIDGNMLVLSVAVYLYRLLKVLPPEVYRPMQSHPKLLNQATDDYEERVHFELVTYTVVTMMRRTPFDASNLSCVMQREHGWPYVTHAICELLLRNKFNAFTIADLESFAPDGIGNGLYTSPSYRINHSCQPNATQTFVFQKGQSPQLVIEIVRPVPIHEEIFITYNGEIAHLPVKQRRQELLKTYNFHCRCTKCLAEE